MDWFFWFKVWLVGVGLQLFFIMVSDEAKHFDWADKLFCVVLWPVAFFVALLRGLRETAINVVVYPISSYVDFFSGIRVFFVSTLETKPNREYTKSGTRAEAKHDKRVR